MMDIREVAGIETYVNDEPDDPNPGIIIDCRENRGRALNSAQARALAIELLGRADYFDSLREVSAHEELLADLDAFRSRCEEAEYTDTGEAWTMIDRLEDALQARQP